MNVLLLDSENVFGAAIVELSVVPQSVPKSISFVPLPTASAAFAAESSARYATQVPSTTCVSCSTEELKSTDSAPTSSRVLEAAGSSTTIAIT